ncbi:MAG: phosphoribosylformylglycinamidine synthase [Leptospirillum sp.]
MLSPRVRSFFRVVFSSAAILSAFSFHPIQAQAASSASSEDSPVVTTSSETSTSGGGSSSGGAFSDIGKLGVGLSWAPMEITPGATDSTSVGFVGARYWFNKTFGFDGGLGFGFPSVSPGTNFLTTLELEPMIALVETSRTILYGNLQFMGAFGSGSEANSSIYLSAGMGVEHALADMPRLSIYGQWDPVSVDFVTGPNNPTGFGFLGSVMNFNTGFRYYF